MACLSCRSRDVAGLMAANRSTTTPMMMPMRMGRLLERLLGALEAGVEESRRAKFLAVGIEPRKGRRRRRGRKRRRGALGIGKSSHRR